MGFNPAMPKYESSGGIVKSNQLVTFKVSKGDIVVPISQVNPANVIVNPGASAITAAYFFYIKHISEYSITINAQYDSGMTCSAQVLEFN